MTVLTAVAAGVGAGVAEKRGRENANLRKLLDSSTAQNNCTSSAGPQITGAAANKSTNATASNPNSSPFESPLAPTTNCTAMRGTYVTAWSRSVFTTECSLDYTGSDMLGVWVFTFADCMEACVSWNDRGITPKCYTVSYDISNSGDLWKTVGSGIAFSKTITRYKGIRKA